MATTILSLPPARAFADNPIYVRMNSDQLVDTGAVYPFMEWVLSLPGPADTEQIFWSITDPETGLSATLLLIATDTPDESGSQFPTNLGGDAADDYAAIILDYLKKYAYLNSFYSVEIISADASTATIRFTAKLATADLAFSGFSGSFTNIAITRTDTATAAVLRSPFRITMWLWVEQTLYANDWVRVPIDGYARADESFEFEISKFLRSYVKKEIALPPITLVAPDFYRQNTWRRYYFQRSEIYADSGELSPEYKTLENILDRFKVYLGGINPEHFPANDFLGTHLLHQRLLTWYPAEKQVSTSQPEFISWLNSEGEAVFCGLMVTIEFTDGSTSTIVPIPADTNHRAETDEVICFPCGYSQLDLATVDVAKTVCAWSVQVIGVLAGDTGTAIMPSVIRTYNLDFQPVLQERFLVFQNALGGWDTLRCKGLQSGEQQITSVPVSRALARGYTAQSGMRGKEILNSVQQFTLSSGWLPLEEFTITQYIFHSEAVFLVLEDRYQRITVTNEEAPLASDEENLQAHRINYSPSFDNLPYSPQTFTL